MRRMVLLALPFLLLVVGYTGEFLPPGAYPGDAQAAHAISSPVGDAGNWSDPNTWDTSTVPTTGDTVTISAGDTVTYDVHSDAVIGEVTVDGTLIFSRSADTRLKVSGNILVNSGGRVDMGTPADPIPADTKLEVFIVLPQGYLFTGGSTFRPEDTGIWARAESEWYVNGSPLLHAWSKLTEDTAQGANVVVVEHDVTDWKVDYQVVITQTSNPYRPGTHSWEKCLSDFGDLQHTLPEAKACNYFWENEVRTITALELLADGTTRITLDSALEFDHQGTGYVRGEVGLLTRNVLVRTQIDGVDDAGLDQDGSLRRFAHTMISESGIGKIQFAEFKYMGHLGRLARYPMHAHMTGATGSEIVFRGNSIWRSGNRGYQVHNTQGVVVEDNVAFDTIMSPYYIERTGHPGETISKVDPEKTPYDNWFVHNLGVQVTQAPSPDQAQQNDDTIFWIDNLDNFLFGNVGVGAGANGGSGAIAAGAEEVFSPFAAMWMDERSGGTGHLQRPYFFMNEMRSNATDGIAFWPQGVLGFEFVDFNSARNGQDGIRWGFYRAPHKVYQTVAYQNGDDGIGSDKHNRSGNRYVQDSEIVGNKIGIKSGPNVVRPIYPDYPYIYNRVLLHDSVEANLTLHAKAGNNHPCAGDPEEEYPIIDRTCHANYVKLLGPYFGAGKDIDFSHGEDAVVNGGNKNSLWRVIDAKGLPKTFPDDFYLLRPDQLDPANRTDFSQKFTSNAAYIPGELEDEALLVPTDSLPDLIQPPTWGHSGSNSGGGELPLANYFEDLDLRTWEKAADYPPEIHINVSLSGQTATVDATAVDDSQVTRVEFFVDDQLVATDAEAPYQADIDLSAHPRNYAYLYAVAYDDYIFRHTTAAEGALDNLPADEDPV
ncbi:MAG: G8 domain-containing protein, partial [Dehalococcoidia bacterium]